MPITNPLLQRKNSGGNSLGRARVGVRRGRCGAARPMGMKFHTARQIFAAKMEEGRGEGEGREGEGGREAGRGRGCATKTNYKANDASWRPRATYRGRMGLHVGVPCRTAAALPPVTKCSNAVSIRSRDSAGMIRKCVKSIDAHLDGTMEPLYTGKSFASNGFPQYITERHSSEFRTRASRGRG